MEAIRTLAAPTLDPLSRDELGKYFENTWELYELLFSSIWRHLTRASRSGKEQEGSRGSESEADSR